MPRSPASSSTHHMRYPHTVSDNGPKEHPTPVRLATSTIPSPHPKLGVPSYQPYKQLDPEARDTLLQTLANKLETVRATVERLDEENGIISDCVDGNAKVLKAVRHDQRLHTEEIRELKRDNVVMKDLLRQVLLALGQPVDVEDEPPRTEQQHTNANWPPLSKQGDTTPSPSDEPDDAEDEGEDL